jgi:hypothetical protein
MYMVSHRWLIRACEAHTINNMHITTWIRHYIFLKLALKEVKWISMKSFTPINVITPQTF